MADFVCWTNAKYFISTRTRAYPKINKKITWLNFIIAVFYRCLSSSKKGLKNSGLACVSQKTRKLYGPEKPFVNLRPAYSVKLVFSYVVKGIKIKITSRHRTPSFWRHKENYVTRKAFGTFEKRAPEREFKPWPLRCWCSAPPVELWHHLGKKTAMIKFIHSYSQFKYI